MNATLADSIEVAAATVILGPLLVLPGAAIAAATGVFRGGEAEPGHEAAATLLLGIAGLPAMLALVARFVGLDAALAVDIALALCGLLPRVRPSLPPRSWWLALAVATVVVIIALVDFDYDGMLYHSSLARDLTKHAATVSSLVTWGVPLTDPYFLRRAPAGYYYYAHLLAALPVLISGGLVTPRAGMGALMVFSGAGMFALALLMWERCRFTDTPLRRVAPLLLVLLLTRNLDIIPALLLLASGHWPVNIEHWNEQVLGWPFSCLWVPQYVVAVIAGILAFMVLLDCPVDDSRRGVRRKPALAGLAFASCVGSSVWIGLGVALTACFWLVSSVRRGRLQQALNIAAAGVIAAVLILPLGLEILHGRVQDGSPIAFGIRAFAPWDRFVGPGALRTIGDLVLLPLNYFFEFGVYFIGAVVFWRQTGMRHANEYAHLLTLCAAASLLLGSIARSVVIYNDLGWRVVMLPEFACLLWTTAAIARAADSRGTGVLAMHKWPAQLGFLALLGYAGNLYNLVSIRAYPAFMGELVLVDTTSDRPALDHEMRRAYSWIDAHLPADAVVQHNPVLAPHIFDFGLYGRNRVAVADPSESTLFGAGKAAVQARLQAVAPIFTANLSAVAVRGRSAATGIDVLLVSDADPVWAERSSWVWHTRPIYSDTRLRLFAVTDIAGEKEQ